MPDITLMNLSVWVVLQLRYPGGKMNSLARQETGVADARGWRAPLSDPLPSTMFIVTSRHEVPEKCGQRHVVMCSQKSVPGKDLHESSAVESYRRPRSVRRTASERLCTCSFR
jgi:hypothetical protein